MLNNHHQFQNTLTENRFFSRQFATWRRLWMPVVVYFMPPSQSWYGRQTCIAQVVYMKNRILFKKQTLLGFFNLTAGVLRHHHRYQQWTFLLLCAIVPDRIYAKIRGYFQNPTIPSHRCEKFFLVSDSRSSNYSAAVLKNMSRKDFAAKISAAVQGWWIAKTIRWNVQLWPHNALWYA